MRDKLIADLVEMADQLATKLSDDGVRSDQERENLLKTWNTMRQAIGASRHTGDRPLGQSFNSSENVPVSIREAKPLSRPVLH